VIRRDLVRCLALVGAFAASGSASAGLFDSTQPLTCDLVEAAQCDGVAACVDVTAEQIDLPPVLIVDFAASRLESEDGERTTPIASVEVLDAVLVLQGHQNGRGWTMVIDRANGHLSATLAEAAGAFVLAGACTAR